MGRVNNYPLYSVNWIKVALRYVINWRRTGDFSEFLHFRLAILSIASGHHVCESRSGGTCVAQCGVAVICVPLKSKFRTRDGI